MSDMKQLDKLLELLALTGESTALDLGCGAGRIAEYISDRTSANVTGVDYAEAAIDLARKRTEAKRDRLDYRVGDIDNLQFPDESFDTIIAIDTLYFVESLEKIVARLYRILKPNGQLGIFHSQLLRPEQPKELLEVERTELAVTLRSAGFTYRTVDFTANEERIWESEKRVAQELRAEFEAEGNLDLCESRITEAERMLKVCASRRNARYLYHATKR